MRPERARIEPLRHDCPRIQQERGSRVPHGRLSIQIQVVLADTVSANEASLEGLIHHRVEGFIPDAKPGTESGAGLVAIRWTQPEMGWARCGRGGPTRLCQ